MKLGLGHLRVAPSVFWRYSIKEWLAAYDGYVESMTGEEAQEPFTNADLEELMEEFPDDRDAT